MASKKQQTDESAGKTRDSVGYGKPPKHTQFGQPNAPKRGPGPIPGETLTAKLKRILAEPSRQQGKTHGDLIMETAMKRAKSGSFNFFKEVVERVDGKVADKPITGDITVTIKYADEPGDNATPPASGPAEGD